MAAPLIALLLVKLTLPDKENDESTTFRAVTLLLAKEQSLNTMFVELCI